MFEFLKTDEIVKNARLYPGFVLTFYYNGKFRRGRIVDHGPVWVRCEMVADDAGFYPYADDYNTGNFRTFNVSKMRDVHISPIPQPLV